MSGPKIDQAELERRKREQLERERQERLRKIQIATSHYNGVADEINKQIRAIDSEYSALIECAETYEEMQLTLKALKGCKEKCVSNLKKVISEAVPSEPDQIESAAATLKADCETIIRAYRTESKKHLERIKKFNESLNEQETVRKFANALSSVEKEDSISIDFEFVKSYVVLNADVSLDDKKKAEILLDRISELLSNESISSNNISKLLKIVKQILDSEKKLDIDALAIQYELLEAGILQHIKMFEEIYAVYYAEYVEYISQLNKMRDIIIPITPKSRRQFQSVEALKKELQTVRTLSKSANEQNYIRTQLDEIMTMFGYSTCESIILESNQSAEHYLSTSKSGKTAIHISMSGDKQIMMEIVGTGKTVSRKSDKANAVRCGVADLTEETVQTLFEEQGQFCSLHPLITEELRKRGIILSYRMHQSPSRAFCKSIMMIDDSDIYIIDEDKSVINVASTARRGKRKNQKARTMKD